MNSRFFMPYQGTASHLYFVSADHDKFYQATKTSMSFAGQHFFRLEEVSAQSAAGAANFIKLKSNIEAGVNNYVLIFDNEQSRIFGPLKPDQGDEFSRIKHKFLLNLMCEMDFQGGDILALNLAIVDTLSRVVIADKLRYEAERREPQDRHDLSKKAQVIYKNSTSYVPAQHIEEAQILRPISIFSAAHGNEVAQVKHLVRSYSAIVLPESSVLHYIVESIDHEIAYTDRRNKWAINLYQQMADMVHEQFFVNKGPNEGAHCHGSMAELMQLANSYWLAAKIMTHEKFRRTFEIFRCSHHDVKSFISSFAKNMVEYSVSPDQLLSACSRVSINAMGHIFNNNVESITVRASQVYHLLCQQVPVVVTQKDSSVIGRKQLNDHQDAVTSTTGCSNAFAWGGEFSIFASKTLVAKSNFTSEKPSPPSVVGIDQFLDEEGGQAEEAFVSHEVVESYPGVGQSDSEAKKVPTIVSNVYTSAFSPVSSKVDTVTPARVTSLGS